MYGIGRIENPLVFQNIVISDVGLVHETDTCVVFRKVKFNNVHERITGSNVFTEACERTMLTSSQPFLEIQNFGSKSFPLVFHKETFVRCTIDCNDLHIWFVGCTFIQCFFCNAENVVHINNKHFSENAEHCDTTHYQFFVRVNDWTYIWGSVRWASRDFPAAPTPIVITQPSATQQLIQRWTALAKERAAQAKETAAQAKTRLAKSESARRILSLTQRRSSTSSGLVPSPSAQAIPQPTESRSAQGPPPLPPRPTPTPTPTASPATPEETWTSG
jgi:hypothetical protein